MDELFFSAIKKQAYAKQLMSRDHVSVDGTLLEVSASMKSFKPKESSDDHNAQIASCGPGEDCLDFPIYGSGLQYYVAERVDGLKMGENAPYMGNFGDTRSNNRQLSIYPKFALREFKSCIP